MKTKTNKSDVEVRFKPNRGGQRQFLRMAKKKKYSLALGGIGSGKSTVVCWDAAKYALALEHSNEVSMVVAPTYNMLSAATMRNFMRFIPKQAIVSFNKSEHCLELYNGHTVWFRNASDPDNLRGIEAQKITIDEGALLTRAAWNVIIGRARTPGSSVSMATTPRGKNWVWEAFVRDATPAYGFVRMPTAENQKHLDPDFIENLGYTGKYAAQELMGEFVNFEGLVYDEFDREHHVIKAQVIDDWWKQGKFVDYVAGVDWGYGHAGAMLVDGVDYDGRTYQIEEHYQRRLFVAPTAPGQDSWLQRGVDLALKYPGIRFFCDPSGAGNIDMLAYAIYEATGRCEERGDPAVFKATNAVDSGISEVASRLAMRSDGSYGAYYSEACPATIAEFESYHYAETSDGKFGKSVVKEGDDAMDADRYKKMGLRTYVPTTYEVEFYRPERIMSIGY